MFIVVLVTMSCLCGGCVCICLSLHPFDRSTYPCLHALGILISIKGCLTTDTYTDPSSTNSDCCRVERTLYQLLFLVLILQPTPNPILTMHSLHHRSLLTPLYYTSITHTGCRSHPIKSHWTITTVPSPSSHLPFHSSMTPNSVDFRGTLPS